MGFMLNAVEKQEGDECLKFFATTTNDLRTELTESRKKLK